MRGGNLIPMEAMEGRYVEGMHRQLVKSSADANMNSARTTRQTCPSMFAVSRTTEAHSVVQ